MAWEFVVVALAVTVVLWWPLPWTRSVSDPAADELPYDDLPPLAAFEPLPAEHEFEGYVARGLERLGEYLAERDGAA